MKYILAIDQGTSSSRCILYDQQANPVAMAQQEFQQIFPKPGWVEHDAEEIWRTQVSVFRQVMSQLQLCPADIAGIGITNQRETTVVWERRTGKPVYNAIVWQDRRTADDCTRLKDAGLEPMVKSKTGLVIDAYFSATKIRWILDHVEGAREKARRGELAFGTIDSWLVWKLTNGELHVTDVSNASRTLLYNIEHLRWDDDLLALFDIPAAMLPAVRSSSELYGHTSNPEVGAGIPIAAIAGDQQAALFGQMCIEAGMAKCTYGTGSFLMVNTGPKRAASKHGLLTTIAWQIGHEISYALEGSVFIGGASFNGYAMAYYFSSRLRTAKCLPAALPITAAFTSFPRLPVLVRRTGTRTHAGRSSELPGAQIERISPEPHWRALVFRLMMCCKF